MTRRDRTPEPPKPTPRCEACHATNTPRERAVIQGIEMELCVNPTACRGRWTT